MPDRPNPDDFSKAEFPNEFVIEFRVEARMITAVNAADIDEATAKANALAEQIWDRKVDFEPTELDEIEVDQVRQKQAMYRVMRNGSKYQTSRLCPGDIPREPDERGF